MIKFAALATFFKNPLILLRDNEMRLFLKLGELQLIILLMMLPHAVLCGKK